MSKKRCKTRRPERDGLRPSDVLAAFFLAGIGFILFAVAIGTLSHFIEIGNARWLAFHAVFVGGVSQLVLGAAQFFTGAFLATGPPRRKLVRTQFVLWNIGTLILLAAGPSSSEWLTTGAVALLVLGLAVFSLALRELQRESLQDIPWATRWYLAAAGFLATGLVIGAILAAGVVGDRTNELLSAHLSLNLLGWFGTAIVGTLHTFFPSLSGAALPRPNWQISTFYAWVAGTGLLAFGFATSLHFLIVIGLVSLVIAAALLTLNIIGSYRAAEMARPLSAKLVAAAQVCLAPGLIVIFYGVVNDNYALLDVYRSAAAVLIIQGWIGLTVIGSLLHLLLVLGRVRNMAKPAKELLPPMPNLLAPLVLLVTVVAAIAYLAGHDGLARDVSIIAVAVYLVLVVAIVRLAYGAARTAPLRL